MYLKRALITQLGTREIRHIKTKRPEPCAIQDSDRWSCLIQFLSNFWGSFQSFCRVFIIICRVPFHFETGPLPALFYPTTVAFVNCQLHQTFSPAFVVFSRTNLRKDPLPCPGQKPENISGVYTILPRFGAKLKAMGTAGCRS